MNSVSLTYYSDIKDGKLQANITKRILIDLCRFEGKRVELHIQKIKSSRTQQQNRFYWVLVGILSHDLGYTKDEVHDLLKYKFLKEEIVIGTETEVICKSTAKLTKGEFAEFICQMQEWAATLGIILPDAGQQVDINL